ncbi:MULTISPECIES: L,D-transpeptidase [Alicyclobacillus]|uniref:L,D-transpeptidase family protein n=1 Tax=Alicyclobacillus acidoterrestris (strain ATCC 49025 / DSM 3922 / CIP 106132 / NCIMB 13137 / GD3B) TaxID=1356854 RepID=T0C9X8_ALIAG|nr:MULTISPECIES: L,D-transpeptidase family protein [Alicyclobacillus]EPZ52948.1 hypothetical protein N007_02260 [Alicyclobacillus acidoterrestris ATCC 49025]UNO49158.1 L,D-transpeptidase family protein [Alicyclobacillus acidoterrestris]
MRFRMIQRFLLTCLSIVFMLVPGKITEQHVLPTIPVADASTAAVTTPPRDIHLSQLQHRHVMPTIRDKSVKPVRPTLEVGTHGTAALWLNEALATLGYLPVTFTASATSGVSTSTVGQTLAGALNDAQLQPLSGTWTWQASYPSTLVDLWNPNTVSVITQGAIIRFQADNHLAVDGVVGPQVYQALQQALQHGAPTFHPYTYVTVSKSLPEHLDVWQNGQKVFTTPANTGIASSPTPTGTWPVYARLVSQTMQGKNPDGSTYLDPNVPYISYFYQGCAIHGFPRASYGSPQSLGCVELPIDAAKTVYGLIGYGTLVSIGS